MPSLSFPTASSSGRDGSLPTLHSTSPAHWEAHHLREGYRGSPTDSRVVPAPPQARASADVHTSLPQAHTQSIGFTAEFIKWARQIFVHELWREITYQSVHGYSPPLIAWLYYVTHTSDIPDYGYFADNLLPGYFPALSEHELQCLKKELEEMTTYNPHQPVPSPANPTAQRVPSPPPNLGLAYPINPSDAFPVVPLEMKVPPPPVLAPLSTYHSAHPSTSTVTIIARTVLSAPATPAPIVPIESRSASVPAPPPVKLNLPMAVNSTPTLPRTFPTLNLPAGSAPAAPLPGPPSAPGSVSRKQPEPSRGASRSSTPTLSRPMRPSPLKLITTAPPNPPVVVIPSPISPTNVSPSSLFSVSPTSPILAPSSFNKGNVGRVKNDRAHPRSAGGPATFIGSVGKKAPRSKHSVTSRLKAGGSAGGPSGSSQTEGGPSFSVGSSISAASQTKSTGRKRKVDDGGNLPLKAKKAKKAVNNPTVTFEIANLAANKASGYVTPAWIGRSQE